MSNLWEYRWGWRQTLSWRIGFRRPKAGRVYSCPWWADERVYGLAFIKGKGLEIPKRPDTFKHERHLRDE